MNYDTYLLSKLLIDNGTLTNGVVFESLPYDNQYDIIEQVWEKFDTSGFNNPNKGLYDCINKFLETNTSINF